MKAGSVVVAALLTIGILGGLVWWTGPSAPEKTKTFAKVDESEGGPGKPPEISETGPYPKAVIDKVEHYFGVMELGDLGKHTFEIRNEGEAPLILVQGNTSCKCTISSLDDDAIPPGESAEVQLEWEPKEETKVFEQQAAIYTNDPENRLIELRVLGEIRAIVNLYPRDGLKLGRLIDDKPMTGMARIYSDVIDEFEIKKIESLSEYVTVDVKPISESDLREQGARFGYELHVSMAPTFPIGRYEAQVKVTTENEGNNEFYLGIEAERSGPFKIFTRPGATWFESDQVLSLGRIPAADGKTVEATLSISGKVDEPIEFEDVTIEPAHLKAAIELDEKRSSSKRQQFNLTVTVPGGIPAEAHGSDNPCFIKARTNHPEMPEFLIKVQYVSL